MTTDSLLVTIAVITAFAFFMVVLGYASFDESRRRSPKMAPWSGKERR